MTAITLAAVGQTKQCTVPGCTDPYCASGLCRRHHNTARRRQRGITTVTPGWADEGDDAA